MPINEMITLIFTLVFFALVGVYVVNQEAKFKKSKRTFNNTPRVTIANRN